MRIKIVKVGALETNCYIVLDEASKEAVVIDPGAETDKILNETNGLKIKAIILTHGHYDHVTEAFLLKEKVGAPVLIDQKDEAMMVYSTQLRADGFLKDGEKLTVGDRSFEIISTPGHSKGGICLYNEKEGVLFSGDTLFAGDYGRVDLPGSSPAEINSSLKKILSLPPKTKVYPGHGKATTVGDEKNLIE